MRLEPVRQYRMPSYPTEQYLNEHPELLRLVPERWRHNRLVLAVLGAALPVILAAQSQSRVAPIFVHGDGRGAFGCVAVMGPVFLSEEEARQVIREEARKAGLAFAPDARTLRAVPLPVTNLIEGGAEQPLQGTTPGELLLDGYDATHNVAFEFVSVSDFVDWRPKSRGVPTGVSFDLQRTADVLRAGLSQTHGQEWVGVFYGPKGYSQERCRANLRKQVRDFIHWLKAQGVI